MMFLAIVDLNFIINETRNGNFVVDFHSDYHFISTIIFQLCVTLCCSDLSSSGACQVHCA